MNTLLPEERSRVSSFLLPSGNFGFSKRNKWWFLKGLAVWVNQQILDFVESLGFLVSHIVRVYLYRPGRQVKLGPEVFFSPLSLQ